MSRSHLIRSLFGSRDEGRRGAVAIQVALMLIAIIGFASLGTEIVLLLSTSRHMQSAADAGVLAAVSARTRGFPADYKSEAFAQAAAAGFVNNAADGTTVAVNSPPLTGNYAGASNAVEVLITQPRTLALVKVVYSGPFVVHARAVAHTTGFGACVLALDTAAGGALAMNGTTTANLINCDIAVNSSSVQAVSLVGGAILNTGHLDVAGGYTLSGGSQINATNGITTAAPATADPYAGRVMPSAAASCLADPNVKSSQSLPPGTYCSISVSTNNGKLTLTPGGNFIVKGGSLSVGGGATLTGLGVTIVLTGSGANYATVNLQGGSTVTLTAPTTGTTGGMAFFQDRNAPASGTNSFNGGTGQSIGGALYFPQQTVKFGGGTSANITCIEIVARVVSITGDATLKLDCTGTGVLSIGGGGQPAMAE
jgi:hypothetical protein